ncbi:hypothetical protein AUC68_06255 [Methyloceanibacter methanicus]|uniref:Chemotaxis protein CheZ n=1 Tax=Methyloceanibacter methanicus TaxID=1774968 RepID=A0A1E3VZW8_9HYPH|nr:hypothetical protein [Methyloceanibacter methanicus]ODR98801.1 hypothetical protein AUC68_06255 [Methyloceanibacter methanicus]
MLKRADSASQSLLQGRSGPQPDAAEDGDYATLEATLKSTELGRRFLADYARQHPTPEVELLLDTVGRLDGVSVEPARKSLPLALISELVAMSETISEMRREIGGLGLVGLPGGDPRAAPCAFEQIVEAATHATSDVLMALEEIQNVSWTLREEGVAPEHCDMLDESAVAIYTACARQEIAGQKSAEAMRLLRDMERRIDALIDDWSDHETQNLLDAANALDVSDALEMTASRTGPEAPGSPMHKTLRTNRLVPMEDLAETIGGLESAAAQDVAEEPAAGEGVDLAEVREAADTLSNGARPFQRPFERPGPLALEELRATQRASLFG